jgi:hypothetical protein
MQEHIDRARWPWIVAICVGFASVLLSFAWPSLFPPTEVWTPDKAREYTKVGGRLHSLNVQLTAAGQNSATRDQSLKQLEALREEHHNLQLQWEALREELESAQKRGQKAQTILFWIGGGVAVLGLVGWLATRERTAG